jgi:Holliday junction resolvase RusA-like endonuclease
MTTTLNELLTFSLPGNPQGKGRARAFRRGNHIGHYTPEDTRSYEGMIRDIAHREMNGRLPTTAPVRVTLTAVFDIPKSFSKKKRMLAMGNNIKPAKKPDIDNIIKAFVDAMNGVVFKDDCQIVMGEYAKVYGPAPLVVVTVRPLIEQAEVAAARKDAGGLPFSAATASAPVAAE